MYFLPKSRRYMKSSPYDFGTYIKLVPVSKIAGMWSILILEVNPIIDVRYLSGFSYIMPCMNEYQKSVFGFGISSQTILFGSSFLIFLTCQAPKSQNDYSWYVVM
jgi:hypothetical protein